MIAPRSSSCSIASPSRDDVIEIVCTTAVPLPDASVVSRGSKQLTQISIAPALAEAMRRIHNGGSVSVLFDDHRPGRDSRALLAWGGTSR